MYRTNLIKAHQYFSHKGETAFDLTLAELLVLEQLANGHKWMTEIRQNCAITDYTLTKSVLRLSDGYGGYKGLELITKHRDGKYKFMSFTPKGLKVRDAIMDYSVKATEKKDYSAEKRHLFHLTRKAENLIKEIKGELNV